MSTPEPTERTVALAEKVADAIRERAGRIPLSDVENWRRQREIDNVARWIGLIEAAGLAVVELPEVEVRPTGSCGVGSASPGPVSGAVPDVRLIPVGSVGGWPADVVAIRRDDGVWHCSNGARLADSEAGRYGRRMIPVGPLLTLADHWELLARLSREEAARSALIPEMAEWGSGRAESFKDAASDLREQLAYQLPDSPTTRQESQ